MVTVALSEGQNEFKARRSSWAKHIDSKLKAPKAKDAEQWLTAPNRFDLPTVDTNKPPQK